MREGTVLLFFLLASLGPPSNGHGRLTEPPGRSTMWRFGFETERNYDDDALWCGGLYVLWELNGGNCGICGDAWHLPPPRPNEDGGRYGKKVVVRTYKQGQVMPVTVHLTKNHKGYFEFRLCPVTDERQAVDQKCLDQHLLHLVGNAGGTRYQLPVGSGEGLYNFQVLLPPNVTCRRCVVQWHYRTGNNWGLCKDGTQGLGCGNHEYFRACADIAIIPEAQDATQRLLLS